LSRRDFEVFRFGTAMTGGHYSGCRLLLRNARLQLAAQLVERSPAWIGLRLVVRVRLLVQILAADEAEAGAVGAVQDLVGEAERKRVAGPGGEVERVVGNVRALELRVAVGVRRLVLTGVHGLVDDGVAQAAEARPVQARAERELEDAPA